MSHYKPLLPSFSRIRRSRSSRFWCALSSSARLAHPIAASIWEEEDMDEGTSKPRVCLTEKELLVARKLSRLSQMLLQFQCRRCRRTTYVFPDYLRWGVWRSRSVPDDPPSSVPPPPPPLPPIIVPPKGRASDGAQRKLSSPLRAGSGGEDDAIPSSSAALPAVNHQKLLIAAKVWPAAATGYSPTRKRHSHCQRQRQRQPPIAADPKLALLPLEVIPVENHQELDGRCATGRAPSSRAMLDLNASPETEEEIEEEGEDQVPAAEQEERVEHGYEYGCADTAAR
ncbi:hypothetical protein GW17_00014682 [Ensete ventricosum]|nr:hypothetical protein GW17_00014682 [Ensete ventricosum]